MGTTKVKTKDFGISQKCLKLSKKDDFWPPETAKRNVTCMVQRTNDSFLIILNSGKRNNISFMIQ